MVTKIIKKEMFESMNEVTYDELTKKQVGMQLRKIKNDQLEFVTDEIIFSTWDNLLSKDSKCDKENKAFYSDYDTWRKKHRSLGFLWGGIHTTCLVVAAFFTLASTTLCLANEDDIKKLDWKTPSGQQIKREDIQAPAFIATLCGFVGLCMFGYKTYQNANRVVKLRKPRVMVDQKVYM